MALKATIYKAELQIADMDRNFYETQSLTLATTRSRLVRWLAVLRSADINPPSPAGRSGARAFGQ